MAGPEGAGHVPRHVHVRAKALANGDTYTGALQQGVVRQRNGAARRMLLPTAVRPQSAFNWRHHEQHAAHQPLT